MSGHEFSYYHCGSGECSERYSYSGDERGPLYDVQGGPYGQWPEPGEWEHVLPCPDGTEPCFGECQPCG